MGEVEKMAAESDDLVVVGSSAGGVEALSVLVSTLPEDFPAPIIVAQHLDPDRMSTLDHILQRHTKLPVEVVTLRCALEKGKIYVVPANRHVVINDTSVEIQEDRTKRPRPSIDMLLSSAAQVYGDRLIAVILTGFGSDGAAGAVEAKNAGGTVIVQDPQTARYPSMPLALPPSAVDFEVQLEQIGPLLYDLLTNENMPQPEGRTEDVLRNILDLVSRQANIDFQLYKPSTILRRIGRRMVATHMHTMQDYLNYLDSSPQEVGELVKAFLINVTRFFRDADAFIYLKNDILPRIIAQARERDRTLRFWAAGCASGEEPYSLAMLLTDILGAELPEWRVKIFATDLDEAAINFARRGIYSETMLKGLPEEYRSRFFERVDSGYRVSKILRQMVIFGQQDLTRSAPFPHIDLVLCRNVLIYFTPELQGYVLNQFAFSLCPNGYLFLGKAETVRPTQAYFELVNKQWKVYRCIGTALPAIRRLSSPTSTLEGRMLSRSSRNMDKQEMDFDSPQLPLEIGQLRRFNELLLRFLPVGVVVIDRNYRIVSVNGSARRLLGLREIGVEQDFLHAIRGIPYTRTRAAIDTVFRERNVVTLPDVELEVAAGGNGRVVSLSIALMQMEMSISELVAISVSDVTEQVETRRQLERVQAEQAQLMNELGTANKRLSDVNKELMDANEELQVANEELMLTQEELQATIEEFETTNEELQASNEELETSNEEMQATNEELETTNEELRARSTELQEIANILDSERARLSDMVELAPFYILVLRGPSLIVEAYNPSYAHMLEERVAQGRPLDEVYELFWEPQVGMEVIRLAREVYFQDAPRTLPGTLTRLRQGEPLERYFVYTLVPSHDMNGKVDGVIIYAQDETEQQVKYIEEERERLRLIFDNTPSALLALYDAATTELILASSGYLAMLTSIRGTRQNGWIGCRWHEVTAVSPHEEADVLWNTALESRASQRIPELFHTLADGQEIIWNYNLTPIMSSEMPNTIRYMLVSVVDITEQVKARTELERLDDLKDDFLSLATHELRTPLTSIQGNAQMLQKSLRRQASNENERGAQFEQWGTILNRIVQQTSRMNQLIGEMLDVTRMRGQMFELHDKENVDIVELVRRVIEQQSEQAKGDSQICLHSRVDSAVGTIDSGRIEQVLQNLLSNAVKYSPKGSPIDVTIQNDSDTANTVIISVHDRGYGISEEEQAHIFDRFYRARTTEKVEGLGLGLYIAHEIIAQQGGRMWVESRPNEGSTFYFSLPLSK